MSIAILDNNSPSFGIFGLLPAETKVHFLTFLDGPSTYCLATASKVWYVLINNGALWQSLELGNLLENDKLRTVRQICSSIDDTSLSSAVTHCTESKNISASDCHLLFELMKRGGIFPVDYLRSVVLGAAEKGFARGLKAILPTARISVDEAGQAVVLAAKNRYLPIVQTLLENCRISFVERGEAMEAASANSDLGMVQELIKNGQITDFSRGKCIEFAAKNGQVRLVRILFQECTPLEHLPTVLQRSRQVALEALPEDSPQELAELLLQNDDSFSESFRGLAAQLAAKKKSSEECSCINSRRSDFR
jgi:hypothetical protein